MKFRLLPVIIATVIGLSAQASAAREYYLVGLRHVYMFDVWPDTHKLDRQAIEEQYSSAVATGQQQYDTDMASIRDEEAKDNNAIHQVDRDAVQQNLEQAIAEAADTRDASLGQLYVQCDYVRATHPELNVLQDGPYQVMGCDENTDGDFVDVCYYNPYPKYEGACPFGWTWGRAYPIATFGTQYSLFYTNWVSIGSPVFAVLYTDGSPVTILAPVRKDVIISHSTWSGGRPPVITDDERKILSINKELQRKAGIRPPSAHPGVVRVRAVPPPGVVSKYVRAHPDLKSPDPTVSRYRHPGSTPPTGSTGSGGAVGSHPRSTGSGSSNSKTKGSGQSSGSAHTTVGDKKKGG